MLKLNHPFIFLWDRFTRSYKTYYTVCESTVEVILDPTFTFVLAFAEIILV